MGDELVTAGRVDVDCRVVSRCTRRDCCVAEERPRRSRRMSTGLAMQDRARSRRGSGRLQSRGPAAGRAGCASGAVDCQQPDLRQAITPGGRHSCAAVRGRSCPDRRAGQSALDHRKARCVRGTRRAGEGARRNRRNAFLVAARWRRPVRPIRCARAACELRGTPRRGSDLHCGFRRRDRCASRCRCECPFPAAFDGSDPSTSTRHRERSLSHSLRCVRSKLRSEAPSTRRTRMHSSLRRRSSPRGSTRSSSSSTP